MIWNNGKSASEQHHRTAPNTMPIIQAVPSASCLVIFPALDGIYCLFNMWQRKNHWMPWQCLIVQPSSTAPDSFWPYHLILEPGHEKRLRFPAAAAGSKSFSRNGTHVDSKVTQAALPYRTWGCQPSELCEWWIVSAKSQVESCRVQHDVVSLTPTYGTVTLACFQVLSTKQQLQPRWPIESPSVSQTVCQPKGRPSLVVSFFYRSSIFGLSDWAGV
jgi:hypothetical protein